MVATLLVVVVAAKGISLSTVRSGRHYSEETRKDKCQKSGPHFPPAHCEQFLGSLTILNLNASVWSNENIHIVITNRVGVPGDPSVAPLF